MSLACSRSLFFTAFAATALALGVSYYLEYVIGFEPCALCLLQRICLALFAGVCLLASVHGPGDIGSFVYWLLGLFCSVGGTVAAARLVLSQSVPDAVDISWTMVDLSIPEWSLLLFVGLLTLSVCQLLRLVRIACQRPLSGEPSHRAVAGD